MPQSHWTNRRATDKKIQSVCVYSKTCHKRPLKKKTENWFSRPIITKCRSKVLQNAPREHYAILSTFIKLPFVFKSFLLSIFEWPIKVRKRAKIRNRYNQAPHLTQDTNGKVFTVFAYVCGLFHLQTMRSLSGDICCCLFYPLASFEHVQVKVVQYSSILFRIWVFPIYFVWYSYIMYSVFAQLISGDVR